MANIVFFILPERGHLNSSFKLGKTLKSRGHQVYYLQIREFEEYIAVHELGFIPLFDTVFPKGYSFHRYRCPGENMLLRLETEAIASGVGFITLMRQELRRRLEGVNAHLLVLDINTEIPLKELEIEIPVVVLNPTLIPRSIGSCPEVPIMTLCPEELDLPQTERTPQQLYVEASVDFQRHERTFQWDLVDEDRRLVYCSLGTQSHWSFDRGSYERLQRSRINFLQTVINALAGKPDWQLILWTGSYYGSHDFHSIPSNALLLDHISQIEVLKKASLMITHGGLNSVKECILLGVPMIVFPLAVDQFKNADCVVHHQLGLSGDVNNATETQVRYLMDEVDGNPVYRANIGAMRDVFRRIENEERAIAIIETALTSAKHAGD